MGPTGGPSPITATFIPIAKNFGLDQWEMVTNTNRHLTSSELLRAIVKYVCQFMIDQDREESAAYALASAPKKRQPDSGSTQNSAGQAPPAKRPTGPVVSAPGSGTITALFTSMAAPPTEPKQS